MESGHVYTISQYNLLKKEGNWMFTPKVPTTAYNKNNQQNKIFVQAYIYLGKSWVNFLVHVSDLKKFQPSPPKKIGPPQKTTPNQNKIKIIFLQFIQT